MDFCLFVWHSWSQKYTHFFVWTRTSRNGQFDQTELWRWKGSFSNMCFLSLQSSALPFCTKWSLSSSMKTVSDWMGYRIVSLAYCQPSLWSSGCGGWDCLPNFMMTSDSTQSFGPVKTWLSLHAQRWMQPFFLVFALILLIRLAIKWNITWNICVYSEKIQWAVAKKQISVVSPHMQRVHYSDSLVCSEKVLVFG